MLPDLAAVTALAASADIASPACAACPAPGVVQWQRRHPGDAGSVVAVYACSVHAIGLDAAARIHRADCPAPDPAVLPACGCDPEPLPGPVTPGDQDVVTLPTGWIVPAN